jgi:WD40 repeat protein
MRPYKLKKCKRVHGLHFAPGGQRLLAVGGEEARMVDGAVWLDLATGENVARIDQFAQCYAVPADASRFVLGGATQGRNWGGIATVQWTATTGPVEWRGFQTDTRNVPPSFRDVSGLAFDPTAARLAIAHAARGGSRSRPPATRAISIVDRDSGEAVARFPTAEEACVMAFNAAGTRLATTGGIDGDTRATVYDLTVKEVVFRFAPPATVTRCVLFLPGDRLVVANGRNVYVLPMRGGEPQLTLSGHPKQVNAVAVAPDGRRLLTASHDGSIRTWDAGTGTPGPAFDWGIGPVTALAFAPDGLTCAAAGLNGKIVVWDADG